jgi:hypothetical protein
MVYVFGMTLKCKIGFDAENANSSWNSNPVEGRSGKYSVHKIMLSSLKVCSKYSLTDYCTEPRDP